MIKVAAYCRVSTDSEDQSNSFEAQQRYFRDYINSHNDWELYEIYADEGITGTTTKRRVKFNRMIQDAYEGRFQMILTKEVSRFSRNILDTISFTRELRSIGVTVLFLTDNINTMDKDAELYLSILASLAQEESRRTSGRVVWGQTRQMEKGVVFGRSLLGYDVINGELKIESKGAEIVRLIFQKYTAEQLGTTAIARFLRQEGYETYRGSTDWTPNAVTKILKNEKYVGDLIQKKTYTPDFLTHQKKKNNGQVPLVCMKDHHEAIISREVWEQAQARLKQNNRHYPDNSGYSNRYAFSGKIRCGECGSIFVSRSRTGADGTRVRRWCCSTVVQRGTEGCSVGKTVRDDDAVEMVKIALRCLKLDSKTIIKNVATYAIHAVQDTMQDELEEPAKLCCEIGQIAKKKDAVMDCYFSGEISKSEMQRLKEKYDHQTKELEKKREELFEQQKRSVTAHTIQSAVTALLQGETQSEVFYKNILKSLMVYKNRRIELTFHNLPHQFLFVELDSATGKKGEGVLQ